MERPRAKGIFHLIFSLIYLGLLPRLYSQIPEEIKPQIGLYLFGLIGHFIASSWLHLIPRSPEKEKKWRQLDHIMIFIYIYSSYLATITTVLTFIENRVIYSLNGGLFLGIISRVFFTDLPPKFIGIPYLLIGWSILLDPWAIIWGFTNLPTAAFLCLGMGLVYTLGGIIYIKRKPNPWPGYIEFHEVFHFLSGIGSCMLTYFIFFQCIPHYLLEKDKN